MSSSSSSSSSNGSGSPYPRKPLDPISRTALRYSLSPKEYELLHQYLISRAPSQVQKRTPKPKRFEKLTSTTESKNSDDPDSNVVALRTALRVFAGVYVGFKGYEVVMRKLAKRRGKAVGKSAGMSGENVRWAGSLAGILLAHKLLFRFLRRLRTYLLEGEEEVERFKRRNPRVAGVLTSKYTPAIGAAAAGLGLGVAPKGQLRVTIAIYMFTRSLEFAFNFLESAGHLWKSGKSGRPSWFGSWLLMPFACGQLLHAFVFDRDCFPAAYGDFIIQRSPEYIQLRPKDYPAAKPWPGTFDIVDALAGLSKLHWPPFISPILFPAAKDALPSQLAKVAPLTSPAHPGIKHTSCAILHPHDPSCTRTFIRYFVRNFPGVARFFALIYGAFALLGYKSLRKDPMAFLNKLSARILRMAVFVTAAVGTSWGSICAFNSVLPRGVLPTQRWFLGGFAGGMWAYVARKGERGNFLYSARLSIDSLWKVGKKRGWWRGVKGGDVLVFAASLALLDVVYEVKPDAVQGAVLRKGVGVLRGEGWRDGAASTDGTGEGEKEGVQRREEQEVVLGETVESEKKEL
ncbi:uncharacterized protein LTR77_005734 [Saxophila tyrrhenica]|uniref:Transmembrane protein 135 N-terminal domain-containing protein n=1 Tax=Saxophila tyrrhenica TaxID=1690608 RepID=A0AAV9P9A9_9PEZI|nr:hypothetical protein LTR77_005734 [Saxophila tyrrhenica]